MLNQNQTHTLIATCFDVLFIDNKKDMEYDIDNLYEICDIRCIISDKKSFYILANKKQRNLGNFIVEINENFSITKKPVYLLHQ
jgi:hypothetical protein